MTRIPTALALALTLLLAACYPPVTRHPVGTTTGIRNDPAIAGSWRTLPSGDDKGGGYFHFLPLKNGGFTVIAIPNTSDPASDWLLAAVTSARFAPGYGFLNAWLTDRNRERLPDQPPGTVPLLYRFDGKGVLTLYMIDEDAAKTAIRAHRIAGDAGKSGTDDATITADPRALDAFFRSREGQALFKKPFVILKRER